MSSSISSTPRQVHDSPIRRLAHAVLVAAVRGRRERGGDWGEAVLAEFAETNGNLEAVRWTLGGLRAAWHERRRRARQLPRNIRFTRRAVAVLVIAVVAGLAVNQWVLTVHMVATGSMENTMLPGDRYLIDKVGFRFTGLHRGDIVEASMLDSTHLKRVIGLPGDTISCANGRVLVNGNQVDEPYLKNLDPADVRTDCTTVTVPPNDLYLLGDRRIVSQDSRQSGPVSEDAVKGRMLFKIWPLRT
ncbi:MAG: signal peptidase [Actinoplanes sp.]|nr:signal peptidase [Actinoplanes sp.]